jgi:nucleoside-diphosphate-sugar epimerase
VKIAITGASGFIGRHVLKALADQPEISVVATSRSSNSPAFLPDGFDYVSLDLANAGPATYAQLGQPDVLIHLAWGGLPNYRSNHHFEQELPSQYAFLKAMVDAGLPSMLVTGTCYEYGMASGCLAEDRTGEPSNAYAFAKISLYRQLSLLKATQPFGLTWARLFYSHGEGQAPSSLLPLLKAAVANGDKSFAMSGGEQLRDYLPVERVADYLVRLAIRNADIGAVNICSGEPISIRRLVEEQRSLHGWDIDFDFGKYPYPDYEPMAFWGDAGKLNRLVEHYQSTND